MLVVPWVGSVIFWRSALDFSASFAALVRSCSTKDSALCASSPSGVSAPVVVSPAYGRISGSVVVVRGRFGKGPVPVVPLRGNWCF